MNKAEQSSLLKGSLDEVRQHLISLAPIDRLRWGYDQFGKGFALTTSFGIQSAVLLHMVHLLEKGNRPQMIWIDTGYLPKETYRYADELMQKLDLSLNVFQSNISPARMEALHGKLWETQSERDLEKYHLIRKVKPLEEALVSLNVKCWASGVRGNQTSHRKSMKIIEQIRGRLSLRPLLEWSQKDVFYYMQKNNLPQHPLFEAGYSTVGDWHSSSPDGPKAKGRDTRFGGIKEECGIHLSGQMGDGI